MACGFAAGVAERQGSCETMAKDFPTAEPQRRGALKRKGLSLCLSDSAVRIPIFSHLPGLPVAGDHQPTSSPSPGGLSLPGGREEAGRANLAGKAEPFPEVSTFFPRRQGAQARAPVLPGARPFVFAPPPRRGGCPLPVVQDIRSPAGNQMSPTGLGCQRAPPAVKSAGRGCRPGRIRLVSGRCVRRRRRRSLRKGNLRNVAARRYDPVRGGLL